MYIYILNERVYYSILCPMKNVNDCNMYIMDNDHVLSYRYINIFYSVILFF